MITGNRGEWSEIYTLFKLLADGKLFVGDADLNRIEEIFYPIIKILRTEALGNLEYSISGKIVVISGAEKVLEIPVDEFKRQASFLLAQIKKAKGGAFSILETEEFMKMINCATLKAPSSSKTDITLVVHDFQTNQSPTLGFSIKSRLGGASTLLNAGRTTNFTYKVYNIDKKGITEFNSKHSFKDRFDTLEGSQVTFRLNSLDNIVFNNNLVLIDSCMPKILSNLLYLYYSTTFSDIKQLTELLTEANPLKYDTHTDHKFYEYKIKRLLTDIALGMTPAKVWDGKYSATGGYLVVKEDGDVLCYHIYNKNQFEDYLFNNTRLETASTTRYDFGNIYSENGENYLKLNLQIRFLK